MLRVTTHHQYLSADQNFGPSTVAASPFEQFRLWFSQAEAHQVTEPEVMSLSTATADGTPSSRFVLLKQLDDRGFVFFTNYNSRKSDEIKQNAKAALAWYWASMHRQVRVVGRVEKVNESESKEYFNSRPVGSRIGAWASPQSTIVKDGEVQELVKEVRERFNLEGENDPSVEVPLPEFWGGWRVIPDEVEFWSGKPSRLHDRVRYLRVNKEEDKWQIDRLAP